MKNHTLKTLFFTLSVISLFTIASCGNKTDSKPSHCTNGVQDSDETAVDCGGSCSACSNLPVACFTAPDTAAINTSVSFTNCAQQGTGYTWNFGDGQSSTLSSPTHSYTVTGIFTVTQTVANTQGTNTTSKSIVVTTTGGGTGNNQPVACFTAPDTAQKNTTVTFTNCAQYATTYSWSFGDGQTSTLAAPTHSYTANGTYTVTQTVTNGNGSHSISHAIVVTGTTRNDYVGTYQATESCTSGALTYTAQISLSGVNSTDIIIGNIGNFSANASVTATVNGSQFTIPSQTTSGLTFSGSGTLSANLLTINMTYTATDGSQTDNCTSTYTKQ